MSAFGSSVINKSNKKLAPKAPVQRKRLGLAASPEAVAQALVQLSSEQDNGVSDELHQRKARDRFAPERYHNEKRSGQLDSTSSSDGAVGQTHTVREYVEDSRQTSLGVLSPTVNEIPFEERPSKRRRVENDERPDKGVAIASTATQRMELRADPKSQPRSKVSPQRGLGLIGPAEVVSANRESAASATASPGLNLDGEETSGRIPRRVGAADPAIFGATQPPNTSSARETELAPDIPGSEKLLQSVDQPADTAFTPGTKSAGARHVSVDESIPEASSRALTLLDFEPQEPKRSSANHSQALKPQTEANRGSLTRNRNKVPAPRPVTSARPRASRANQKHSTAALVDGDQSARVSFDSILKPVTARALRKSKRNLQESNIASDVLHPESNAQAFTSNTRQAASHEPFGNALFTKISQRGKSLGAKRSRKATAIEESRAAVEATTGSHDNSALEQSADVNAVDAAVGKKRRKRGRARAETPSDAENFEIDTSKTRLVDLTTDRRRGKKSSTETKMQNIDWAEVTRRRKEMTQKAMERVANPDPTEASASGETAPRSDHIADKQPPKSRGPQLKLVNGQMVVDTSSLTVPRASDNMQDGDATVFDDLERRVTSHTYKFNNRRDPLERFASYHWAPGWTEESTDAFYDALRMFGTDFYIISKMFPGRTRKMVKKKFVREEHTDPQRIKQALTAESVPMDFETYCAATGASEGDFKDPEVLKEELRAQDEQQKLDIERQREEAAEARKAKQEAAAARAKEGRGKKGVRGRKNAAASNDTGLVADAVPSVEDGLV